MDPAVGRPLDGYESEAVGNAPLCFLLFLVCTLVIYQHAIGYIQDKLVYIDS